MAFCYDVVQKSTEAAKDALRPLSSCQGRALGNGQGTVSLSPKARECGELWPIDADSFIEVHDSRHPNGPGINTGEQPSLAPEESTKASRSHSLKDDRRSRPDRSHYRAHSLPHNKPKDSSMPYQGPGPVHNERQLRRRGKCRALLVGLDYRWLDDVTEIQPLSAGNADARRMRKVLVDHYEFAPNEVRLLTDDDPDLTLRPTREAILSSLTWLVEGSQKGDSLVFFYAGHAATANLAIGQKPQWAHESDLAVLCVVSGLVFFHDIWCATAALPPGTSIVCLIDAPFGHRALNLPCLHPKEEPRALSWDRRYPLPGIRYAPPRDPQTCRPPLQIPQAPSAGIPQGVNAFVLCACGLYDVARELLIPGLEPGGLFSVALCDAMTFAARRTISVLHMYELVHSRMIELSRAAGGKTACLCTNNGPFQVQVPSLAFSIQCRPDCISFILPPCPGDTMQSLQSRFRDSTLNPAVSSIYDGSLALSTPNSSAVLPYSSSNVELDHHAFRPAFESLKKQLQEKSEKELRGQLDRLVDMAENLKADLDRLGCARPSDKSSWSSAAPLNPPVSFSLGLPALSYSEPRLASPQRLSSSQCALTSTAPLSSARMQAATSFGNVPNVNSTFGTATPQRAGCIDTMPRLRSRNSAPPPPVGLSAGVQSSYRIPPSPAYRNLNRLLTSSPGAHTVRSVLMTPSRTASPARGSSNPATPRRAASMPAAPREVMLTEDPHRLRSLKRLATPPMGRGCLDGNFLSGV